MIPLNTQIALPFFLQLLLGHVVGDFVLQPYWLVLAKRSGWSGLIIHVGVVTFVTSILAWGSIPNWWIWMIVLFIGHLFIDQFRTFIFTDNSKGKGLLLLILDQIAHVVLIVLIAWAATGWTFDTLTVLPTLEAPTQYRMLAYLIGIFALIGTAPVLEAEITVAVWAAQGQEVKQTVRIDTDDRVLGAFERIVATFFILFGLGLLAPVVFLPRLGLMIHRGQARQNRTAVTTKVITSFASAVIVALLLNNIPIPLIIS
jgi:hypothetical protein